MHLSGAKIHQRPEDGYINATDMCKAAGKFWSNYAQNAGTKAFLDELSSVPGIPGTELIQTIPGSDRLGERKNYFLSRYQEKIKRDCQ